MPWQQTPLRFESYDEAGVWLRATFGAWADGLSAAEHDAVCYYTSPAYESLKLALREHRLLHRVHARHVAALDRALSVPLPEPVIVELERFGHCLYFLRQLRALRPRPRFPPGGLAVLVAAILYVYGIR